jgi:N-acetylneuraminic acid mutarotase
VYDEIGDRMIVFGGDTGDAYQFAGSNDVWELDLSTLNWSEIMTSGEVPSPRWYATAIVDPVANDLVVFGGHPGTGDLYRLDLDTGDWRRVLTDGPSPAPVEGHTAVYDPVTHSMVVFGGLLLYGTGEASRSELWVLDLESDTWTELEPAGIAPTGRWGHSCIAATGRCIFFGGVHTTEIGNYGAYARGELLNDVFALQYLE